MQPFAHRNEVVAVEGDRPNGRQVHLDGLKELWSLTYRLRVVDENAHGAVLRTVGYLNGFLTYGKVVGSLGSAEEAADGANLLPFRVFVELIYQKITVFHSQWKLLHVNEKDGALI